MNLGHFNIEPDVIPDVAFVAITGVAAYLGVSRHRLKNHANDLQAENEQLRHAATHDSLTGLPNRVALLAELDREAKEHPGDFGLIFVDLDDFKKLNDTKGHQAGDTFLRTAAGELDEGKKPFQNRLARKLGRRNAFRRRNTTAAEAIAATVRTNDENPDDERREGYEREDMLSRAAFRLAGDEFVIIVAGADTPEKTDRVIERVDEALAEKNISASMAGRPHREGESGTELLDAVDKMMFRKKEARKKARDQAEIAALPLTRRIVYEAGHRAMRFVKLSAPSR
jgi:GGDEF domain-containing protein